MKKAPSFSTQGASHTAEITPLLPRSGLVQRLLCAADGYVEFLA
jgi:hypothetical protein